MLFLTFRSSSLGVRRRPKFGTSNLLWAYVYV
jgi:hypothetical protein